nr:hypothetical protein [Halococcus salifodinae]
MKVAWPVFVLAHRLLEPLAQRILELLELVDLLLQIVADALDTHEGPLASQRRLRSIVAVRFQLLLVRLLDALDGALGIEQDVIRDADILIEGCTLFLLRSFVGDC